MYTPVHNRQYYIFNFAPDLTAAQAPKHGQDVVWLIIRLVRELSKPCDSLERKMS